MLERHNQRRRARIQGAPDAPPDAQPAPPESSDADRLSTEDLLVQQGWHAPSPVHSLASDPAPAPSATTRLGGGGGSVPAGALTSPLAAAMDDDLDLMLLDECAPAAIAGSMTWR